MDADRPATAIAGLEVREPQEIYRARELTARVPRVVRVLNQIELKDR